MPVLVHEIPGNDVIEHEPVEHCVCGPYRVAVGSRRNGLGWYRVLVIRHPPLTSATLWEV